MSSACCVCLHLSDYRREWGIGEIEREIGRVRTEKGSETQGGERKREKEETQSGKSGREGD